MGRASRQTSRRGATLALALALTGLIAAPVQGATVTGELTATLQPTQVTIGQAQSVTGRLASGPQGLAGVPLALEADRYPFRHGFAPLAQTTTAADGSFAFLDIRLDRNTRLRVAAVGPPVLTGPVLEATVDPKVTGSTHSLGPGRVRLTLRVRHAATAHPSAPSVWWFLATRARRVFRLAAVTRARESSPGVTYASVIVDPPSKRFVYRVCLNPRWDKAMGPADAHRRCPEATFVLGRHAR
jgi:hypothetical protein